MLLSYRTRASHLRSGSVYLYAFVAFGEFAALLIGLSLVETYSRMVLGG